MNRLFLTCTVVAAGAASAAQAVDRIQFRQEFGPVSAQRHTIAGPPADLPGLSFLFEPAFLTLEPGANGITNPVYEGETREGTNPLYSGGTRGVSLVGQIRSLSYEWGPITSGTGARDNIVHRDIATRNVLLVTDFGTYSSLAGEEFSFGSDAPDTDYFGAGPVVWTTASPIRLYLGGDETLGDFIEFGAGTWYSETAVPAPGSAMIVGLGGLAALRRRR